MTKQCSVEHVAYCSPNLTYRLEKASKTPAMVATAAFLLSDSSASLLATSRASTSTRMRSSSNPTADTIRSLAWVSTPAHRWPADDALPHRCHCIIDRGNQYQSINTVPGSALSSLRNRFTNWGSRSRSAPCSKHEVRNRR